ncbi:MAG: aminotransferase class I/II-fold pyridoxal phosphate-dependent enzyme, partial [Actinobacteria bacterium]|nr:aminotransferase class I/II-fold pyridoxal phosphate-dependent enzyme [Actinomycetota bacterium]
MSLPSAPVSSFASDNAAGVHPLVLESIVASNQGSALAYGADRYTDEAVRHFRELCACDLECLFVFGGTGGNVLALASLLETGEAVLATDTSHIHVDEAGAPERLTGTKIITVPHSDGKLTVKDIEACVADRAQVHHPRVGVVSITQVTEMGTVYDPDEVARLAEVCHRRGLRLHMDGARIANAVVALGGDESLFRELTKHVDAVTFGATKNGGMFGEAVIVFSDHGKANLGYIRKQLAQLPSKMRFVSAQFNAMLADGLWLQTAAHANTMARGLYERLTDIQSLQLSPPQANSLFPTIDHASAATLRLLRSHWWP